MRNVLILSIIWGAHIICAQSKNDIKKYHVRSVIEESSKIENGVTIVKKELNTYDASGNLTEEAVFINDKLEKKESYKFNKNNEETEHSIYNKDGTVKKKVVKKYNNSGKVSEEYSYDGAGKLITKEIYSFNNFGDKSQELIYNGTGELEEKVTYKYNSKGLKTEKLTFDNKDRLIGKKTYTYTFK